MLQARPDAIQFSDQALRLTEHAPAVRQTVTIYAFSYRLQQIPLLFCQRQAPHRSHNSLHDPVQLVIDLGLAPAQGLNAHVGSLQLTR